MRIALGQINPVIGDIAGNVAKILDFSRRAEEQGAGMVVFPEMSVCGYPPRDLLLKEHFVFRVGQGVQQIAAGSRDVVIVVGAVMPNPAPNGKRLHNVAVVSHRGRIIGTHAKSLLPDYDVFDEVRYFAPASEVRPTQVPGYAEQVGFCICEDLWNVYDGHTHRRYPQDPVGDLARAGGRLLINISASPFWIGKQAERLRIFGAQAAKHQVPLIYVNQVGGNDDLVFDGASAFIGPNGQLLAQARAFAEDLLMVDVDAKPGSRLERYPDDLASAYDALVLGTRDYVTKCGFHEVVLGASGGVDSAVTAAIAVDALGPDRVHLVAMPSRFSSELSMSDAKALATNLGTDFRIVPIEATHTAIEKTLAAEFAGCEPDVTEENLQSRIRGNIVMALSNKFGWLVLTTGNKSELSVGYCTLYGDMCGGLAVISDVPKTMVYRLAEHINQRAGRELIPRTTITRPPTAELRPNQTDQDTLPPYELLDPILQLYVEQEQSEETIIGAGFEPALVREIIRRVDSAEYKRRQMALGLKVTSRAFGPGRRMPVACRVS